MTKQEKLQMFDGRKVRTLWDDEQEKWYFSIGIPNFARTKGSDEETLPL